MYFLKLMIKLLIEGIAKVKFYKWLGFYPPQGVIFKGMENIKIYSNFSLGPNCQIYASYKANDKSSITFGKNVHLNSNVMINADCGGEINIGSNVLIGPNVVMRAAAHNYEDSTKLILEQGHKRGKITIEDDVWVGANAVILQDVVLKKGCVVGAGSVVTKDVEEYSVVGGVPAKSIGKRS